MKFGKHLYIIGMIATVLFTGIMLYFYFSWERQLRLEWIGNIILTVGALVTARLYVLLKMSSVEPEAVEDFLELEDYTLYLRGFGVDKKFAVGNDTSLVDTAEVLLAKAFKPAFVTIGKPDEPHPIPGARRTYIPHDDWKTKVLRLIDKARVIVIRIDRTEGLLWELEQIKSNGLLGKTILFRGVYEDTDLSWDEYCAVIDSVFDVRLPEEAQECQFITFGKSGVFFDSRFSFFYDFEQRSWKFLYKNRHRLHLLVDAVRGRIPFWSLSRQHNMMFQLNTLELYVAEINVHLQELGLVPVQQSRAIAGRVVTISLVVIILALAIMWLIIFVMYLVENVGS